MADTDILDIKDDVIITDMISYFYMSMAEITVDGITTERGPGDQYGYQLFNSKTDHISEEEDCNSCTSEYVIEDVHFYDTSVPYPLDPIPVSVVD